LAAIARRFTPSTPLHLTTRQDIELHDLAAESIPAVQAALAQANLSAVGACGDTLRNVTVCPCSGVRRGSVDLHALAEQIRTTLQAMAGITTLPRKFKIALACSETCGQPWINDLGFVARRGEGGWGFRVVGAGSLGARPATGIVLFDCLSAADVLPLAHATVELFAVHGDRGNRARARLRHVRQRLGDAAFRELLGRHLDRARARQGWPDVRLPEADTGLEAQRTLTFLNGDLSPAAAEALGDLAERDDLAVRIANHHRVVLFGRSQDVLAQRLGGCDVLAEPARVQPAIVACPGRTWCMRGLTDTRTLAERLARLWAHLPGELTVGISGCPNGCAQSAVADIGLVGRVVSREGQKREVYDLLTGGGMGRDARLAEPLAKELAPSDIPTSPPGEWV
jgi:sulfite reductase (ferredoxin)